MEGDIISGRWTSARGLDWAAVLPAACALHCTLAPLLASLLPLLHADHRWEWAFWGFGLVVGFLFLRLSWPAHRRWSVPALAAAGAAIWGAALLGWVGPEAVAAPLGGLMMAGALWWNGRLRHAAVCADCSCRMHP